MDFSPGLKNLIGQPNSWRQVNTYRKDRLGTTSLSLIKLENQATSAAGAGNQQASPALEFIGRGWSTGSSLNTPIAVRQYLQPQSYSTAAALLKFQYNINNTGWNDGFEYTNQTQNGVNIGRFTTYGYLYSSASNSSPIDTLQNVNIVNPSGSQTHLVFTFGSTIRYGMSSSTSGDAKYYSAGSSPFHSFYVGSTITSQSLVAQIYGSGIYNSLNNYNGGKVTAGSADTSPIATLNSYGSLAIKGVSVTSPTYTIAETETLIYANPDQSNVCGGTAPSCSTYTNSSTCGARSAVGCNWFSGTSCSIFNGDINACTGQSPCTLDTLSCSSAANTDQSSCEALDDSFGGNCSWNTSACPSQPDQTSCESISGCSPEFNNSCSVFSNTVDCNAQTPCSPTIDGDCSALSDGGGDGTNCATQPECSYDNGTGACSGFYFTACNGNYFSACVGNLCDGNYNSGNCSGSFGAECQGSANCGAVTTQTPCNAEPGCEWSQGQVLTLPTTALSNKGGTSRLYGIIHAGTAGTVQINANTGDDIVGLPNIVLTAPYQRVLLHNHQLMGQCSAFLSQSPCEAQSGCSWANPCGENRDQTSCEAVSGCSWDGGSNTCNGNNYCTGTYTVAKRWFIVNQDADGALFQQYASVTVANTVTETSLLSTGKGITLLPKNYFSKQGVAIRIRARGTHSSTGNPTITFKVKLGATVIGTITGISGNGSGDEWELDSIITCRSTGGSGSVFEQGTFKELHNNGLEVGSKNTAAVTVSTTVSQQIGLTLTWGTANAGNTLTVTNLSITPE